MPKLDLATVTLCAASSVNLPATIAALKFSLDRASFAECLLFTDVEVPDLPADIRQVRISRLRSARDYSEFIVRGLSDHIRTEHCLIVQWDGFVLDPGQWHPEFLQFDYIGARWPQFDDGKDVGNGGFSFRSKRLLDAGRDPRIRTTHPEDVTLCRVHRPMLENDYGIRFADRSAADRFSYERARPAQPTFGFHGIFNMIPALGPSEFWKIYRSLEDRSTAFVDFWTILRQLGQGPDATRRRLQFVVDRARQLFGR